MNQAKRFWNFLKEDTWPSWFVSLILLVVLIRFVFFPSLAFVTGSPLPLVVIESCSLYHDSGFESWWDRNGAWYESKEIGKGDFLSFPYKNGMNKGDIVFVWGRGGIEKGDIIVFDAGVGAAHPIIHRVVSENPLGTKGDHNPGQLTGGIDETNIPEENVIGKASFRVPFIGWLKLVFFEFGRPDGERGLCS